MGFWVSFENDWMTIFKTLNGEWRREEQGTGNATGNSSGNASVNAAGIARWKQLIFLLSFGGVCWIKERRLSTDYIKSYSVRFHKIIIILLIGMTWKIENTLSIIGNVLNQEYRKGERNAGNGGECYIPGNILKHSVECCQTLRRRVSSEIPGNVCVTQGDEDAVSVQDFMEFVSN